MGVCVGYVCVSIYMLLVHLLIYAYISVLVHVCFSTYGLLVYLHIQTQ